MKKIYIILLATLLCACSAQKRLAHILATHPELQGIDTVYVHDTTIIEGEHATLNITLDEIIAMNQNASSPDTAGQPPKSPTISQTIGTPSGSASADLTALGNGEFELSVNTKTDTVVQEKKIYVPKYYTATIYKDKEVYKMHWYQTLFYDIGIALSIYHLISLLITILTSILKK